MAQRKTIFDNLLLHTHFISGGTHYIKQSSRTARMNDERYPSNRVFYFGKSERVEVETEVKTNPREIHIDIGSHNIKRNPTKRKTTKNKTNVLYYIKAKASPTILGYFATLIKAKEYAQLLTEKYNKSFEIHKYN